MDAESVDSYCSAGNRLFFRTRGPPGSLLRPRVYIFSATFGWLAWKRSRSRGEAPSSAARAAPRTVCGSLRSSHWQVACLRADPWTYGACSEQGMLVVRQQEWNMVQLRHPRPSFSFNTTTLSFTAGTAGQYAPTVSSFALFSSHPAVSDVAPGLVLRADGTVTGTPLSPVRPRSVRVYATNGMGRQVTAVTLVVSREWLLLWALGGRTRAGWVPHADACCGSPCHGA